MTYSSPQALVERQVSDDCFRCARAIKARLGTPRETRFTWIALEAAVADAVRARRWARELERAHAVEVRP